MKITFDPLNQFERVQVQTILDCNYPIEDAPVVTGANVREHIGVEEIHVNGRRHLMDELKVYITDAQAGVELDANGTPWIDGIHATTKSKKADGTWTKKRGTDDTALEAAELSARAKIAGTPVAPEMPPVEVEEVAPPVEMSELVALYAAKQSEGLITADEFSALYATFNTTPVDLAANETARRQMFDHLNGLEGLPS